MIYKNERKSKCFIDIESCYEERNTVRTAKIAADHFAALFAILLSAIFLSFMSSGKVSSVYAASYTAVVTIDGLNVRTGAGITYEVMKSGEQSVVLSKDTRVKVVEETTSGWYKVTFTFNGTGMTGYVASSYLAREGAQATAVAAGNAAVTNSATGTASAATAAPKKTGVLAAGIRIPGILVKKQTVKSVKLKKNAEVTIKRVKKKSGKLLYKIYFKKKKKTYSDYIDSSLITIKKGLYRAYALGKTTVYKKAGVVSSKSKKQTGKTIGKLSDNKKIKIIKEKTVNGTKWFYIRYKKNNKTIKGWVMADKVMFVSGNTSVNSGNNNTTTQPVVLSDSEFETEMTAQGFPESYKPALRTLHTKHPYWQFKCYKTGLDWETAVKKESALGKSLVPNTRITGWKSSEPGAYDPINDKYIVYDGTMWVCASKAAVAYYMDPRNFLDEKAVFMFEALGYEPSYQTAEGVLAILADTLFGTGSYTYTAEDGNIFTKTYVETFMEAAGITGASPVHLASRVKQEVVTGKTSVSNSVSGTVNGYEGIYNFYNIGANDSATGQAVINGLKFASSGTTFMRPWNNQYKAIVGGAKYIADNYISKGQNTIYLERFNVTSNNTYDHQYMTNTGAAYSEAIKNYSAYQNVMDKPFVFYIPTFNNMPDSACLMPSGNQSPNNYLKTLTVAGAATGTLYAAATPFVAGSDGSVEYVYSIPASEGNVVINAAAAAKTATITMDNAVNGGTADLSSGQLKIKIKVKAEDGTIRKYSVVINRV